MLIVLWAILVSWAVISVLNPKWLQKLSRSGVEAESFLGKRRGDADMLQGNYMRAILAYQQSLEINPRQPGVMLNLAGALMNESDNVGGDTEQKNRLLGEASKLIDEALRMDPGRHCTALVNYKKGELLERQGKSDEAIGYYEKALGPDIPSHTIYRRLGVVYTARGEYEKALAAFEKALKSQLDPDLPYQNMLRRVSEAKELDPAVSRDVEESVTHGIPADLLSHYDTEIIRLAQQRDPEIAITHNHLGVVFARMGNYAEAIRHFQISLEIWPGNIDARKNLPLLQQLQEQKR